MDTIDKLGINIELPPETDQENAIPESERIYSEFISGTISKVFGRFSGQDISADSIEIDLGVIAPEDIPDALSAELERALTAHIVRKSEPSAGQRAKSADIPDAEPASSRTGESGHSLLLEYIHTGTISSSCIAISNHGNSGECTYRTVSPMEIPEFSKELDASVSDTDIFNLLSAEFHRDRRSFYRYLDVLDETMLAKALTVAGVESDIRRENRETLCVMLENEVFGIGMNISPDKIGESDTPPPHPPHISHPTYSPSGPSSAYTSESPSASSQMSSTASAYEDREGEGFKTGAGADPKPDPDTRTSYPQPDAHETSISVSTDRGDVHDIPLGWYTGSLKSRDEYLQSVADSMESLPEGIRIHIDDAGLIILSPFLPRLFSILDYLDQEGRFVDIERQIRAAHLVRCLAYGFEEDHYDNKMVLPKIICGLSLQFPAGSEFIATDQEHQEAQDLLETVRQYWRSLKGTSIEGMQETFIRRHGSVEAVEDKWLLRVEGKAFDILMEEIPWGYTTFLPAWNEMAIFTEWQKEY